MSDPALTINLLLETEKVITVPYTTTTTAEDVCITVCKHLGIGTLARHLFALRVAGKAVFLMPNATFEDRSIALDFRIRFKAAHIDKLKILDPNAYNYYFQQARTDVLENKIPDLVYEKYRRELLGLGITDMYRIMREKGISREVIESEYKKYIPKDVLKKHAFFIKKPIHDHLVQLEKNSRKKPMDASFIKAQYIKQLELIAPQYLSETYKAVTDSDGHMTSIIVKVAPSHMSGPTIKYCLESKKDQWILMCTVEELGFISIRNDGAIEISRINGIPIYLKFHSIAVMLSFVTLLDGYYRLTCKWTFNLCQDLETPSLRKLHYMKCHGPVGGEFSYAKLEMKTGNSCGCFIIRESETSYNTYYIDVCIRDSSKPKTFKLEKLKEDEFVFNDDVHRYRSIQELISAKSDPDGAICLKECLPPSEYDVSPLLLCRSDSVVGDALTDSSSLPQLIPEGPVCINYKDLQVYKDKKSSGPWCYTTNSDLNDETCSIPLCSYSECKLTGPGIEYGGSINKGVSDRKCLKWDKDRKKVLINGNYTKIEKFPANAFPENSLAKAKKLCRNPDGDIGGPWCFVENDELGHIEKEYCDVPFCYDPECSVFTKNSDTYMHYTDFNGSVLTEIKFGVKLWDSDSWDGASARLVLTVLALPLTGQEISDLGVGIEIFISNKESALRYGNKDKPEYEPTPGILTATNFTMFTLSWDRQFITFGLEGQVKPIFLAEMRVKDNLMGLQKDKFDFYSAQGTNVLWSFPFCLEDDECDVHTTTGGQFQQFWPLRQKDIVYDLYVHVRAFRSASILITPSPTVDYPFFKVVFKGPNGFTRVTVKEFPGASEQVLKEIQLDNIIDYWVWSEFSISFFANGLQIYMKKPIGMHSLLEATNEVFRGMRWFSVSSENTVAHWSFFCPPPRFAQPPTALLPECAINTNEPDYIGTQDITNAGLPCLPWSGKKMIPDDLTTLFANQSAILSSRNYCRDPATKGEGTFCYALTQTPTKKVEKQFCHLRKCKSQQCKMAGTGNDFIGQLTVTRSGRKCDTWNVTPASVHPQYMYSFNESYFAEMNSTAAKNYCRNPNRDVSGSWCYTMDPKVVQDVCGIRDCDRPDEMIVIISTDQSGRRLYVLPQWKEEGVHGGLRFALKEWNPDLLAGIVFVIFSKDGLSELGLVIGAQLNEKVEFYHNGKLVDSKTYPHLISAGVWTDFWLQMRKGEIMFGFKGVPTPLFEWRQENIEEAFEPVFVAYHSLFNNMPIGLFFQKDECHTENTTDNNFLKFLPIGLYSEEENVMHTNLTLKMRGLGQIWISLMWVTNNLNSYQIKIDAVEGQRKEGSRKLTHVHRGMWKVTRGKKVEVALKFLKQESQEQYIKNFLNLIGQWAFLKSSAIVRLFGIAFSVNDISLVMEYFKLGPLDQYLRDNKGIIKAVDLIEATSNLASAVWHLKENDIIHGRVRCRKLMVYCHEENAFTVKLADPGIYTNYEPKEIHWIPVEYHRGFDKRSSAADVWAMATTMFEIFTYGQEIPNKGHTQTVVWYLTGNRLPKPPMCPDEIYSLMVDCWQADPHMRKQPQEVSRGVNQLLYQVYNSRKKHAYDTLGKASIVSNHTPSNDMNDSADLFEQLISPNDPEVSSTRSETSLSDSSMKQWLMQSHQDLVNFDSERSDPLDLTYMFSNMTNLTATTSLDSLSSMQSIFELDDTSNVILQGRIGQGFYGDVFKASLEDLTDENKEQTIVAVKKLKSFAQGPCVQDFEREIAIMKTLKHPNIVEILGVSREPDLLLVMEFVPHGSLQSYLKINKERLRIKQLLKYSVDIAQGMDYLGKKNIVHRDLAARNILVVDENRVKISDFGLAQFIGNNDYYILKSPTRELPIKWYAPESLSEGKFSVKSDVWSYGVTLYEMFDFGEDPPPLGNIDMVPEDQGQQTLLSAILSGARFPCSEHCPQTVYVTLMRPCWEADPHERPTFHQLTLEIENLSRRY